MPAFTLREVLDATGASIAIRAKKEFTDIVTDTRKIEPGVLFIALKGERFNGEDFAAEAADRGAAGILVSEECPEAKLADISSATVLRAWDTLTAYQQLARFWRRRFTLPVIAITGSNGKTTTKDMTAAVLGSRWQVLKTQANFNNEIGLPLTLLKLTPAHQAAVVEIGMRGFGQIAALAPLAQPQIGIVTNVGETHMELLGSLENIARAKAELVEAIQPGGTVILNADNSYVAAMADKVKPGVRCLTFGLREKADLMGSEVRTEGQETHFCCTIEGKPYAFTLPMVGEHNVYNALAALTAGYALGFSPADMQRGLAALEMTGMRFEYKKVKAYTVINDAYNASPMSMTAAIRTLAQVAPGRRVAVMGDMLELGSVSVEAHRRVGQELAESGAAVLVTRGEMGEYIAAGAEAAGLRQVYRCSSHEAAGAILREVLQPGDTILFKGSRGMQMEKIIDLL